MVQEAISKAESANPWFIRIHIERALSEIAFMLKNIDPQALHSNYPDRIDVAKTVAVIMAGNIPLVGFQDFAHVLISGHKIICKLSSDDNVLLPVIADILCEIEQEFKEYIYFENQFIKNFDAVIATGTDNTARYFEYYFSKYPHIIRKNRNSIAVLNGQETNEELEQIADDVFMYFGFGCRNVSFFLVPEHYDFQLFIAASQKYSHFQHHTKYMNNYEYYRAIHIVNATPFVDGGFCMLIPSDKLNSPPGIFHYLQYYSLLEVNEYIDFNFNNIQCIVSVDSIHDAVIMPGNSQSPGFTDFSDGIDTLKFLSGI